VRWALHFSPQLGAGPFCSPTQPFAARRVRPLATPLKFRNNNGTRFTGTSQHSWHTSIPAALLFRHFAPSSGGGLRGANDGSHLVAEPWPDRPLLFFCSGTRRRVRRSRASKIATLPGGPFLFFFKSFSRVHLLSIASKRHIRERESVSLPVALPPCYCKVPTDYRAHPLATHAPSDDNDTATMSWHMLLHAKPQHGP